jgi:hypothetical protein
MVNWFREQGERTEGVYVESCVRLSSGQLPLDESTPCYLPCILFYDFFILRWTRYIWKVPFDCSTFLAHQKTFPRITPKTADRAPACLERQARAYRCRLVLGLTVLLVCRIRCLQPSETIMCRMFDAVEASGVSGRLLFL